MNDKEQILQPWYAINDDPKQYETFTSRFSGADGNKHNEAMSKRWDLTDPQRLKAKAIVEGTNWLRTVTRTARLALQGAQYNDDKSIDWYKEQKERGLCDVYYYFDQWSSGPLQPDDHQAVICWYSGGDIRYFNYAIDEQYNLSLVEREMFDKKYQKPELFDNSEQLAEVLIELSRFAGGYWGSNFLQAALKARSGDLVGALNLSQTGSGMGSWYDTPFFESTKELTASLAAERHFALLYLINCT